jgi:hypothetical protein
VVLDILLGIVGARCGWLFTCRQGRQPGNIYRLVVTAPWWFSCFTTRSRDVAFFSEAWFSEAWFSEAWLSGQINGNRRGRSPCFVSSTL